MDMDTDLDELNDRFDIFLHSLSIYISLYMCSSVCVCVCVCVCGMCVCVSPYILISYSSIFY